MSGLQDWAQEKHAARVTVELDADELAAVAKVCHETNRGYSFGVDEGPGVEWDQLSNETRRSTIEGVGFVVDNFHACGRLDGSSGLAERIHNNWMTFKLKRGWTYGEEKNEEAKKHPALLPFDELDETTKFKDELFVIVARAAILIIVHERQEMATRVAQGILR